MRSITNEDRLQEWSDVVSRIAETDPKTALTIAERVDSASYGIAIARVAQGMDDPQNIVNMLDTIDSILNQIDDLWVDIKEKSTSWREARAMKTIILPSVERNSGTTNGEKKAGLADRVRELTQATAK